MSVPLLEWEKVFGIPTLISNLFADNLFKKYYQSKVLLASAC
jgi:hypothetical protein